MRFLFLILVLAFPALEIYTLLQLARELHWWVMAWLIFAALAGVALIKETRFVMLGRFTSALQEGRFPLGELIHSARSFVAGALLIFPGIVSDLIALTILLMPNRQLAPVKAAHGDVIEGQFRRE
ncbi:MAG: FxsA family protein [Burkholderiales bacterium]